ncbi:translational activator of GCN4 [Friedmanniomyces endolithicus]|uniref:eIF-2-alpha kinase activator GCN1 n=1 Tax=Friedmanniomyces endolithicus TaxID=329885 RepID=A0AAN6QY03_9PEZI|nr:translational activator of GCN4 [Friedmanniomyces endolithicus]
MAETVTNGDHALDLISLRTTLLSNSTKRRVQELQALCDRLDSISTSQTLGVLDVLHDTYALYVDTRSRQAVEKCLSAIATLPEAGKTLPGFIANVGKEASKPGIAPGNAFVLVRWCCLLIQHAAGRQAMWDAWGIRLMAALTHAFETLLVSHPKDSTLATAFRVGRRAFRTLAKADFGTRALDDCIVNLTAKGSAPTARNALLLGVIAGVCDRLPNRRAVINPRKAEFIGFYVREILGSRTRLPAYIAKGLCDFFTGFVSLEDLEKDVVPSLEKSLLRAPEIVLNDLVTPVISALPPDFDLSDILEAHLLKPLLSNIKSSNVEIRDGAMRTFAAIASRCHVDVTVGKVCDEILGPLRANKIPGAEQRILYANMLRALGENSSVAVRVPQGLLSVASKESNEAAASAELDAISRCVIAALNHDLDVDVSLPDAFAKGLSEKRLPMRRLWALHLADILWAISDDMLRKPSLATLVDTCIGKLIDVFNDVATNPVPALQAGQVSVACATTAICLSKLPKIEHLKGGSVVKKASIAERAMALEPKPSFLLSTRIYTKLTAEDDLRWYQRALIAAFPKLPPGDENRIFHIGWAQALIYLVVSASSPPSVRNETLDALRSLYASDPVGVSKIVIDGLWQWCEDVELDVRDSAATAARTGRSALFKVVRSICPPSENPTSDGPAEPSKQIRSQMISLLVLCRPQLVPHAMWIELCLRTGVDPGHLASHAPQDCLRQIMTTTENDVWRTLPSFQSAAFDAAAELAFVAPDTLTTLIVKQISFDLEPSQLSSIGPTEAAIYRTPERTAFVDVLSKQAQSKPVNRNTKDYDTLKWEQDLRSQIAEKKGQTKKLTAEEQSSVNAQLLKESQVRKTVAEVEARLRRGIGMISALVTGPPTEAETWFGPAVSLLFEVIEAGAGLVLGDIASLSYLQCANKTSSRLGALRPFVGVATLRSAGITLLPENLLAEPLGDLVTRLMYRLRFLGEQKAFDTVTLSYILALVFLILEQGGIDRAAGDDADEQIILAVEFLSFHTEACSDPRLPREKLLRTLIKSMERYTQHFRALKDCFTDLCRCVAPTMTTTEVDMVVKGVIVSDSAVRGAVLQAISAELELTERDFCIEVWLACHDDSEEHRDVAHEIWEENGFKITSDTAARCLPYLASKDPQLRRAAARAAARSIKEQAAAFEGTFSTLRETYVECAKPRKPELDRYGMPVRKDISDPWETRHGVAVAFRELAAVFPQDQLAPFMYFLIENGPLSDRNGTVRDSMVQAATSVVTSRGKEKVEELMKLCENTLGSSTNSSQSQDLVSEAVVILYGALARHLPQGDPRVPEVVERLLSTLSTPSESVQYAVAQCLPPLVRASSDQASQYLQETLNETLHAKKYAARRGAAYGLAGVLKGKGLSAMRESRLLSTLRAATENKKDANERQGAYLAYELMSLLLGRIFEPYVIQIVPQLLVGFGDASSDVREACLDAAKTCFASLSSYGVKQVLPTLLEGLDESQWRSKKGASDSLGAMAYLDPEQLATSLPEIIPPLTDVLNDTHKEVRASAKRSLQRFGEVITNPEVKSQVDILLKALSDPTKYTDDALDALIKVKFIHYLDAPSLALVVRILERGLGERSGTKRKAAQIIGSLAHLTERRDLSQHLPILVAGLRVAIVDPVPATRATASKALGSTIEKLGEDALPDLIPDLMQTLKSDTGAGDRLGSAQALSEVLAGLGTGRLEETLPTILQNVASSKASVREGFMSLFIFLPACFGQSFANYLSRIIPPILAGLADDIESIRETALRAGRLLVKNFAARSVDLLLPELERGLADDSYRIRLSSVELVGDLLYNLTGISGKTEAEDMEDNAPEAGQSLLEVLGQEKRDRVLSGLYICRCDTSGLVRTAAITVWKALVSTPRTLRELIPTLTQLLIRRLASSNMEQKVIAGNALGELIRKAGEGVLASLLPTLEEGLQTSTDTDARQGICIALRELIASASPESLEDYEKTLISVVRTALVDSDEDVREAAAEAFDSLQKVIGKRSIDQVLPHLLALLRSEDDAENALAGLLTLLTEASRSNVILPNLLPTLLTSPISAFNARALASLAQVASSAMTRRLPNILNALMDNIVACKDDALRSELDVAFDTVLVSVDEFDGLNTMMSAMRALVKHDDHRKRASADTHLAKFFQTAQVDFSRYYPDLIRVLLIAFDDSDKEVVKAAWSALSALTQRLRKEEMESLVVSTRQTLNQVGVAGHDLPGFSLPKGINAVLPIFLQGLMNGSAEQRTQAALAISDLIDRTSADGLKPFVTQITGPLIRVVSERSTELKAAILLTLNNLLEKIPTFLKPFLPQLQRTFAKSLADPSSEILRSRAAKALGTLITMTPRIDPLIAELVTGAKTTDAGVKNAMLKALYEVVSKAGSNMSEVSRNSILGLIDSDSRVSDAALDITFAKLLGALIKVLPQDAATSLIKSRVLTTHFTHSSVLALNAVLVEAPEALIQNLGDITESIVVQGIGSNQPFVADNSVLAAGKYLLAESSNESFDHTKPLFDALARVIQPGSPVDTRRLALVVVRTISREHNELVRPHLETLAPPVFACVRDPVIPVKLAAEAAFLAIFDVVDQDNAVFDKFFSPSGPGARLPPAQQRSMKEYFTRIALRLSNQAKERREAEGGQGGLNLSSDETEDLREVMSVGKAPIICATHIAHALQAYGTVFCALYWAKIQGASSSPSRVSNDDSSLPRPKMARPHAPLGCKIRTSTSSPSITTSLDARHHRRPSLTRRKDKRLAASVAGSGKRKIWLDPNETNEISNANSRQTIRKLIADGLIIRKPVTMHSRSRARELNAARRLGRHRGMGKRKGTADARMPTAVMWMRRLRVLRRLLVKYRAAGKIDKHLYHELYHLSKGNTFKHKRALVEHIHKAKAEKAREQQIKNEMDAKRAKTKAARERRQERVQTKRNQMTGEEEETTPAPAES